MKSRKHRNRSHAVPNPVIRGFATGYEPSFKRTVILYAEQKSNSEARKRFGISEETIKRWRKLRREIMEMAQQCVRRSQRHAYTSPQASTSQDISEPPLLKKEKEKGGEEKKENDGSKTDLDSMPLQQRLSQNHNEQPPTPTQEPVLQSQPISPTKLKVTRQGAKPQPPPTKAPTPPPHNPEVCLRWNSHHTNMQSAFPSLLTKEQYVDATLVSEGKTLKCHRMILSSCSSYFEEVLDGIGPLQHPVIFMKDVPFWIIKALCDYMYAGEVHIYQDKLQELLNVAETFKIKGLAGNSDPKEDVKPIIPEIKQEEDTAPPPKILERPPKEEKEEEPPPSAPKLTKHDMVKSSKKKDDKKSKHYSQAPKEKEREKVVEEPPLKVSPKITPKTVLSKVQPTSKTTVKNVMKNVLSKVPKPSTSKAAHTSRKSDASRKSDKHKADNTSQKEKEKEKEKPSLKKDNINDPLDLLQPVYEEIAKEEPPLLAKSIGPAKLKERGNIPVRKGVNKKVKKRRYAEYAEEREESPPPVFSSRKGTRSRPNVKIPKFFHTTFDETQKEITDATIVREPHTDQSDPLIGLDEVEEIKAEPLDLEENTIEMEENLENYMQDQEMTSQEGEEIIGNYDSPIVNIKREGVKRNTPNIFKKIIDSQPVIMNIHTVTEGNQPGVRLLNIKEENLKIVDIAKISTGQNRMEDFGTNITFGTIVGNQEKTSEIMISNVQSMAEICDDNRLKESEESKEGPEVYREREGRLHGNETSEVDNACREEDLERFVPNPFHSIEARRRVNEETLNITHHVPESETSPMDVNEISLKIKVENIQSDNSQDGEELVERHVESETELGITAISSEVIQEQETGASLGSLETKLEAIGIENELSDGNIHLQISEDGGANLSERVSDNIYEPVNEIGQNAAQECSLMDKAAVGDAEQTNPIGVPSDQNVTQQGTSADKEAIGVLEQTHQMEIESEPMSIDSQKESRLERSSEEPYNCSLEKIQKTVEGGDIGTEREAIIVAAETCDAGEIQTGAVEETNSAHPSIAQEDVLEPHLSDDIETDIVATETHDEGEVPREAVQEADLAYPSIAQQVALEPCSVEENVLVAAETHDIGQIQKDIVEESDPSHPNIVQEAISEPYISSSSVICQNENISVEDGIHGISEPSTETVQKTPGESLEMMSVGTVSQEMMSIGTVSQEMMSMDAGSQTRELEASQNSTEEEIQKSDFENRMAATGSLSQYPVQNPGDYETVQNEGVHLDVREGGDFDEAGLQRINYPKVEEVNTENENCVVREGVLAREGEEVVEHVENTNNTPEMMSVDSQSQDTEQNLCQLTVQTQESEIPNEVRNTETETLAVISVNNVRIESSNREDGEEGRSVFEYQHDDRISNPMGTKEPITENAKNITDVPENIEAELEQCLASTSNMAPIKLNEEKLKISTARLSFEEDEDFTKDIEFDNFIGRNRTVNYVEDDFGDDFEMGDVERSEIRDRVGKSEGGVIRNENRAVYNDNEVNSKRQAETVVEKADSDRGVVNEDMPAESYNKVDGCDNADDDSIRQEEQCNIEQNYNMDVQVDELDPEEISSLEQNIKEVDQNVNPIKNKLPTEHSDIHQNIPETPENFKEHHECSEDEQKLEDSLLADDEDIEMKEASTSVKSDEGPEKTLEMIVNDLNESLGEFRK